MPAAQYNDAKSVLIGCHQLLSMVYYSSVHAKNELAGFLQHIRH